MTRIDAELAKAVDDLVEKGIFDSRSDAVRKSLAAVVDKLRRNIIRIASDRLIPQPVVRR